MARGVAVVAAFWLVYGGHVWLLAVGLGADPLEALPVAIGGFAIAFSIGPLLVVLPAGAGVREAVLVVLLAGVLTTAEATAVALTSRGILMLTDGLLAMAAGAFPPPPPPQPTPTPDRIRDVRHRHAGRHADSSARNVANAGAVRVRRACGRGRRGRGRCRGTRAAAARNGRVPSRAAVAVQDVEGCRVRPLASERSAIDRRRAVRAAGGAASRRLPTALRPASSR